LGISETTAVTSETEDHCGFDLSVTVRQVPRPCDEEWGEVCLRSATPDAGAVAGLVRRDAPAAAVEEAIAGVSTWHLPLNAWIAAEIWLRQRDLRPSAWCGQEVES
jgi:hypothetical protein